MGTKKPVFGVYEQLVNDFLADQLKEIPDELKKLGDIDKAEATDILSAYLKKVIAKSLDLVGENAEQSGEERRLRKQIDISNKIIQLLEQETGDEEFSKQKVDFSGKELLELIEPKNNVVATGLSKETPRPQTSLVRTSLFTGAQYEPLMVTELKHEILTADEIDMLVSFVKWSGIRHIINELAEFTQKGGKLRIITTSYMGATDYKAVAELSKLLNTEIKISYDTQRTRLHAKSYIFYRKTGFSTAYVGSSNLSYAAISSGLEWNLKITAQDLPDTFEKIKATFAGYWQSDEFSFYDESELPKLKQAIYKERHIYDGAVGEEQARYFFRIDPYPFQQRILEAIEAERELRNHHRNLVVAATGTGKTVISAFDYKNFCEKHPGEKNRMLFIAHREEILKQSLSCYRDILRDNNFGELFTGRFQAESPDHLFMSIQTFNSKNWTEKTSPDFYDYIVVDEMHHSAAKSYEKLLTYYEPKALLGLTATPERMDGKDVTVYFGGSITAEIRLPDAIERKLLCPFHYFGVTDNVDLSQLKWERGGYVRSELSNVFTLSGAVAERRVRTIIDAVYNYTADINLVHGIGFCVSKEHAAFMSKEFNKVGIKSIYLTADSSAEERNSAKDKLRTGKVKFIFVVDLYNEGVDIPEIDTILFLRPTESLTVFLQQLGRGLRLSKEKDCLTVLDFVGQANKKYRFADKFTALLKRNRKGLKHEIETGFNALPAGCHIELEKKAQEYILENIKHAFAGKISIIERIKDFDDSGKELSISNFIDYFNISFLQVYRYKYSFAELCVAAERKESFADPDYATLKTSLARFADIDSRRWIAFMLKIIPQLEKLPQMHFSPREIRMLWMLYFTIWNEKPEGWDTKSQDELAAYVKEKLGSVAANKEFWAEVEDILQYNYKHIDFIDKPVELGFDCPLDVHCHYTRDQLFAALDYLNPGVVRQGVKYLKDKKIDVFINTLVKTEKDYSPTTMYKDYSIDAHLFHWESQNNTSETSPTGKRYINHVKMGSSVLLFVREFKNNEANQAAPFIFLGKAEYVSHEGSKPMGIVWRLEEAIPGKYIQITNKLAI